MLLQCYTLLLPCSYTVVTLLLHSRCTPGVDEFGRLCDELKCFRVRPVPTLIGNIMSNTVLVLIVRNKLQVTPKKK
jgi:hypothetical protein